jgi:tetratricopeptide (TPR) repeat protein
MIKPPKSKLMKIVDDANRLHLKNDFKNAKERYLEALKISPNNSLILWKLGDICIGLNQFDHAAVYYSRLEILNPENIDFKNNFAHCLIKINAHESAEKVLLHALNMNPNETATYLNLTVLYCAKFDYDSALNVAKKALLVSPSSSLTHNNLGAVLQKLGHYKLAEYQFETSNLIDPDYLDPQINLAGLYSKSGNREKAKILYENMLKRADLDSDSEIKIKQALSAEYLSVGNLKKGWEYYELGLHPVIDFEMARNPKRTFKVPRWKGESLKGKTILIWGEQGIGDEFIFMSCFKDLYNFDCEIIIECQSRIVKEFARSFPKAKVRESSFYKDIGFTSVYMDYDYHLPMGSLPSIFRNKIEDFNNNQPYLLVDNEKSNIFESRLKGSKNKLRVGICWRSGMQSSERNEWYTNLNEWGPIFNLKNCEFINLQYGECEAEILEAESKFNIKILRWSDLDLKNDFESSLALISRLDVIVTVATAVHGMAGSVGVKTFLMAHKFFMNLGTENYPWFQNMVFVQPDNDNEMVAKINECIPKVAKIINDSNNYKT